MSTRLPGPVKGREAVEGDPRLGVLSPRQGLPAQNGSQAWTLDVPAIPGCLPHLLLCNLPRDCLCSFDRQASRWSLQPHRWGPPLISSPTLQLGRSRARPSPQPSKPSPPSPSQLLLQENRHFHLPQSFLSATAIRGLSPTDGRGWEARGLEVRRPGVTVCDQFWRRQCRGQPA